MHTEAHSHTVNGISISHYVSLLVWAKREMIMFIL